MLGIKSSNNEDIIKINKKIKLIKCEEKSLNIKEMQNEFLKYDFILIDTSDFLEFNLIKKITNEFILILEANLIGINNSKNLLDNYFEKNINNLKIIINKNNFYSINEKIINNIFYNNKIIGNFKYNIYFNFLINYNFKIINLKIKKEILKIIKKGDFIYGNIK